MSSNEGTEKHEYLIVGAGPAGLQLGYFLEKAERDYLILEAGDTAGTFFKSFPRHRQLISNNKVHTGFEDRELNLRWDWNSLLSDSDELLFRNYSTQYFPPADDMVRYLSDFADHFQLKINYSTRVTRISKNGGFTLLDDKGKSYSCERLIIATGFTKPYLPPIPGIELTENYAGVSVDPEEFTNQRVLVIGKGNSGFETADNLIPNAAVIHIASPHPISMAWKTHFVGHLRALNNDFLDTYQLKSQNAVIDATIEKVARQGDKLVVSVNYSHANGETEDLVYDRVIVCAGFRMDDSIFDDSCRPELTISDRFPRQTSEWQSTNINDLYFVGTLTQVRDWKTTTSGFIHGFRYNARGLHRLFEQKYHNNPWPVRHLMATPDELVSAVIKRVNSSSALWQQFGFLCDVIVVPGDKQPAAYYEEMPVAYVQDTELGRNEHYYTVTLEFGHIEGDPFNITRNPDPAQAPQSTFLHPVVRRYAGSTLLSEHHVLEDLYGEWRKPEAHIKPLLSFFNLQMLGAAEVVGA